jgi:hypothetical protein
LLLLKLAMTRHLNQRGPHTFGGLLQHGQNVAQEIFA